MWTSTLAATAASLLVATPSSSADPQVIRALLKGGGEIQHVWANNELVNASASENIWDCDVRPWVRAPDLAPGISVPGEVRLAMNGSDCGDVVGWSVGLTMMERGVMKTK